MNNGRTNLNYENLDKNSKLALDVIRSREATKEAVNQSLRLLRKKVININPAISAKGIVLVISDTLKAANLDGSSLAHLRMQLHLVERGEIKAAKI
jgi:hypothetical protein